MYILYELPNGTMALVEANVESLKFMLEHDREVSNAERNERRRAPVHIEAMDYEGLEFTAPESPEEIIIERETASQIREELTVLTEIQLRRVLMRLRGLTVREIAEAEGVSVNAVEDSLLQARRKLEKTRDIF